MDIKLKPCPFCGSTSLKLEHKHNGTHYWTDTHRWTETHSATVRCNKCHARGGTASVKVEAVKRGCIDEETKRRAIDAWNRRDDDETN